MNEKLKSLRTDRNYSADDLAQMLGVSADTVLKWENGDCIPCGEILSKLAKIYKVSVDTVCTGVNAENGEIVPNYEAITAWELWSKALDSEYRQCYDEGKDVEGLKDLFTSISRLPATKEKEEMCDALFKIVSALPTRDGYKYAEPNTLDAIFALRTPYKTELCARNVPDSVLGGWFGRICGCLLGKPIEGVRSKELEMVLSHTDNWPISRYLDSEDIPGNVVNDLHLYIFYNCYSKNQRFMPADDDTNYMLTALRILERFGRDFTSANVAQIWMESQPKGGYCTAERVAYQNFCRGIMPPQSAEYKNAYREWIGAQIRADVFGYINPCNPQAAAEMAWRDARISHVKNGIYGEMWVAAMIAAAFGTKNIMDVIRTGLSQIPATSRLYEAVEKICTEYESGRSEEATFKDIASRWDEYNQYDWCHTVVNAEIVTACLLYGGYDYGKSVCLAVSQGFDTDCNAATVGSVLGVLLGKENLPAVWTDRVNDTLRSTLVGPTEYSITEMANHTLDFLPKED